MEVIILSKTHFGNNVCVGGMALSNKQFVRLLNPGGWYQFADTEFQIGDIWDINFITSNDLIAPHNEDVIIQSKRYIRKVDKITEFILEYQLPVWIGSINNIFEGKLLWSNTGAGYLSINNQNLPTHSVGFWISDKPLKYENDHYFYPAINGTSLRKMKYKGIPEAILEIPANTLLRVSLAKWWKPNDSLIEKRCYLQLSGWFEINNNIVNDEYIDDLPF